jgi:hypothetical protein
MVCIKLLEIYKKQNIEFTIDEDYTHAIILNTAMPKLNIPKENVLGLAYEPFEFLSIKPEFVKYAKKYIGKYFIGCKHNLPEPFKEYYSFMWFSPSITYNINITKNKIMSIVLSQKKFAPGHMYRHVLVENIIRNNIPIDIYGRGANNFNSIYVKGEFLSNEPYNDYLYSICIENFISNDYISEKLINPMLNNCMPIYIGAKQVSNYFQDYISLTGDLVTDLNVLVKILKEPIKYYKHPYNERNLRQINIFENINMLF